MVTDWYFILFLKHSQAFKSCLKIEVILLIQKYFENIGIPLRKSLHNELTLINKYIIYYINF